MADTKEILDSLSTLNVKLDLLASHDQDAEEEAARQDAEEAAALAEQAASSRVQAQRAATDHDAEEAARHTEEAKAAHTKACTKRAAAAARYDALAARAKEAGQADATAKYEAAARDIRAEDAKQQDVAAAAEKAQERQVAAQKDTGGDRGMRLFKTFMAMLAGEESEAEAKHDDEAEDKALIRRMMREKQEDQKASTVTLDLQTKRTLRDLQASNELITDTLKKMTGLITDMQQQLRGLSTDTNRGNNGGPVRRSMQGTGERYIGKFDDKEQGTKLTEMEFDAKLQAEGITDPRQRMARTWEARQAGDVQ